MNIELKLEAFEGPLDLLLHLIDQAEVDIYDISVAEVTKQYMDALHSIEQLELELASEFLVMAATLLAMKSKSLLPKPSPDVFQPALDLEEDDIDPREELIRRLVEYKRFKVLAERLKACQTEREHIFTRMPTDLTPYLSEAETNPVRGVTIYHLIEAFQSVMRLVKSKNVTTRVRRDPLSVSEQVDWLSQKLNERHQLTFFQLFDGMASREVVVVTFLALLELIKKRAVTCEQHGRFGDIVIAKRETKEVQSTGGLQ